MKRIIILDYPFFYVNLLNKLYEKIWSAKRYNTKVFGKAIGAIGTTTGEIVFNTGMTGYQEIFTDPSYFGQLMITTNAHIGNYGVAENE